MSEQNETPVPTTPRAFKRASVACKACNLRKVRCTVTLSGPPCANCSVDGIACEVLGRKRRRNADLLFPEATEPHSAPQQLERDRETKQARRGSTHDAASTEGAPRTRSAGEDTTLQSRIDFRSELGKATDGQSQCGGPGSLPELQAAACIALVDRADSERTSTTQEPRDSPCAAGEDSSAYADTLGSQVDHGGDRVPFYPGDQRGPAFVMDICEPHRSSKSHHFLVPMPSVISMLPEDMNYLRIKGAFALPPPPIRDALVRSYFHHVHPFAPILDVKRFILEYEKGKTSLLLLWSMFLTSASFLEQEYFTDDFFPSRRTLKRAAYGRAKNKVTLIQSVFLMSHWYTSSTEDRTGPWHWNGIAISLSHTIGLHRLSEPSQSEADVYHPVWRRLWWSIYCREVWLSLGQGRPTRIRLDDSDTLMPTVDDDDLSLSQQPTLNVELRSKYLPDEFNALLEMWCSLVRLTIALGTILLINYRPKGSSISGDELEKYENAVRACEVNFPTNGPHSKVLASHVYQFKLYFEATIITLYRADILDTSSSMPTSRADMLRSFSRQKARAAAARASAAVGSILAEDLVGLCHTITILALGPPMQIHLFESTSPKPMEREMGKHNLGLCMVAMNELRKSYVAADAAYKLFERASEKIRNASLYQLPVTSPSDPTEPQMDLDYSRVDEASGEQGQFITDIMTSFWGPFSREPVGDHVATHTEDWLDIQEMDRNWTSDDFNLL
ncbi:hypothetical protein ACJZ2D_003726 [Fusarium nematophilum]